MIVWIMVIMDVTMSCYANRQLIGSNPQMIVTDGIDMYVVEIAW